MISLRLAGAALAALCLTQVPAGAQTKATYDTEQAGPLILEFGKDGSVTGEYPEYQGHIKGTLKGTDRIDGTWWQSKAASDDVKCDKEMNGTLYWGKFTLIENADQKGFHGMWGSCDHEPDDPWSGTLKQ
ncbi:MAG TPA: hypothetical protein VFA12_06780 [Stellaceae bacterium]|nr:hypothetical protein [Stellaceae bacterium]